MLRLKIEENSHIYYSTHTIAQSLIDGQKVHKVFFCVFFLRMWRKKWD